MDLMNAVAWALVELQGPNPNVAAVRAALDKAMVSAARLAAQSAVTQASLARIAMVHGG